MSRINLVRLVSLVLTLGLLAAACAPAATPTPAPAKPAAPAPTQPPAAAKPTTAPAAQPTAAPAAAKPTTAPAPTAAPAAAKPAATSGQPTLIRWAVGKNLIPTPVFVGIEKGIFLKHGFDVKTVVAEGAQGITKALQVGEADIGQAVIGGFIPARVEGLNVRGIGILLGDPAAVNDDNTLGIVASAASGITKPADMVGKKLGAQAGASIDTYLRLVLLKAGVPIEKVQILNVLQTNTVAALSSGTDAVSTIEPYVEMALAMVPGSKLVVRGGGYVTQRVIIETMEDWLPKNRQVAERLLIAAADSMQYIRQHPDEAADITGRWLAGGIDQAVLRRAIRWYNYDPRLTPTLSQAWAQEDQGLLDLKKTKRSVPYTEGFDPSLAEKVQKENPQYYSDLKPLP